MSTTTEETISITEAAKRAHISRTSMYCLVEGGYFDIFQPIAGGKKWIYTKSFNDWKTRKTIKASAYGKAKV